MACPVAPWLLCGVLYGMVSGGGQEQLGSMFEALRSEGALAFSGTNVNPVDTRPKARRNLRRRRGKRGRRSRKGGWMARTGHKLKCAEQRQAIPARGPLLVATEGGALQVFKGLHHARLLTKLEE